MHRAGLTFLLLCSTLYCTQSQTAPAEIINGHSAPGETIVQVKLGESSVELAGPWKFRIGDDMAWAQVDFDDSNWDSMDLTPPPGSADATLGISGYIPGWTARGYAGHSGFAWYRLKIDITGANRRPAIKMPAMADDAYQVFVNGQQIGEMGKFVGNRVTAYSSLPQSFRLPKGVGDGKASIAIRMWMDSATPFNSPDAGGLHGPPVLGYATVMEALVRLDYDDIAHDIGIGFLEALILIMALVMALALFWLDRKESAYLWLALVCLVTLVRNSIVLFVNFTPLMGQTLAVILTDVILAPVRIGLWVLFWGYWFRLRRIGILHRLVWPLVVTLMIGTAMLRPPLYGLIIPVHDANYIAPLLLIVKLALGVLLFVVAFRGFARHIAGGWFVAIAVLLVVAANYQRELRLIHVKVSFLFLGFLIQLGTVATILSLLVITALLLRRFVHSQRLKEQWKMEIQQARHVQEVLIPQKLPQVKGLHIESEYHPAREVGGDFFQILPNEEEGTVLIVVGDVTGKGLQAGMLVALIVGAIRAAVQHSSNPLEILREINEQLCERQHASATCLILRIDPDGKVILANAGQQPPYLNGIELEMEGALPVGTISDPEFSTAVLTLEQNDSLILMSDGVVEAQNHQGILFGFERVNEMLRQRASPREIAQAAKEFGQEDDILVLQVRREATQSVRLHLEPQFTMQ
ncbi:PP2C family protein-serine/threonine phosphatase [Edaphobacter modestus]|uniref:Serine phosphatase RsbU (Regulator of sigma subunit) n=1 Tax=Edaphobacter modestus TaxID=388466 RepID=A0A4Q7YNM0_9BACT|nr:SpoIIE family protein phosphatase [Edaphobacter modestus]RZU39237.1 serine phosphatase RsbU (regulator of sigma subunit) [Edaphobacter modestus]